MHAPDFATPISPVGSPSPNRLSQMRMMIKELSNEVASLERAIKAEEKESGVADPKHFAYSCYCKAASARCDNLRRTIGDLKRRAALESLIL